MNAPRTTPPLTPTPADSAHAHAAPSIGAFDLKPLMFEACVCTLAMMSFVALIGPISRQIGLAPWQAGTAMTVGGIAWVLCARYWGVASDRYGRRRILLRGLGGFVLSYTALCAFVLLALSRPLPLWLTFGGVVVLRGIAGGFYAAVPATGAALIADHVPPARRAGALATLGAASGIGLVAGPGVAGLLAAQSLSLPLLVTALLPPVCLIVLWRWLPRHEPKASPHDEPLKINDPRLRRPLIVAFVSVLCVTVAQIVVGFFALDRLGLDAVDAARVSGIALTVVGGGLIVAQVVLQRLHWSALRLVRSGCALSVLGFALVLIADAAALLWAGYFIAAAGMGWVFPSVSAMAANAVQAHEQGATAGTIAAAHGLGMIAGPIIGTLIYGIDPAAPYALIAALLASIAVWPGRSPATHRP